MALSSPESLEIAYARTLRQVQPRSPSCRSSLDLLGDGFVEAVADQTLIDLSRDQCKSTHGRICSAAIHVPINEAPGQAGVGRFGWKTSTQGRVSR